LPPRAQFQHPAMLSEGSLEHPLAFVPESGNIFRRRICCSCELSKQEDRPS
jgi:hypothetical protein